MVGRDRTIETLIERLNRLPGVGPKTAERLAFHLLRVEEQEALELAKAIHDVREAVKSCSVCFQLDASDPCSVCSDETRERDMLLIVEDPREVARFEEVGYRGVYHVLQGRLSQLEGIKLEDLTIRALIQRVEDGEFREICLATNPDLEGEGTAQVLADKLQATGASLTRLARGLPAGSSIAQVSSSILSDAIEGRRPLS
ncbi:MAG: recombination mediator RecR [Planctomycetota bacterium]|nr:recombination mediator RecR [Planctomycetota bacterium]MEC9048821.1 recombination mediator RecR [Planctomycetota bacterium]